VELDDARVYGPRGGRRRARGERRRARLERQELAEAPGVGEEALFVAREHVAGAGHEQRGGEDHRQECIVVGSATPATWTFRSAKGEICVPVSGRVRVDSFRVARALAARGAGIVRTARMFAEPLVASGALVPVLDRYWPTTPLHAVHAGPNPPAPKVRAFVELARAAVGKVLSSAGEARS
jgi:DNA-binding transcriptional LysR family regulator